MFIMRLASIEIESVTSAGSERAPLAGKQHAPLQMPRVSGNAHIGHSQERFIHNSRNLNTVAPLRFHVRDKPLQRGLQRFLPIGPEDGGRDFSSHEEERPSFFPDRFLERGTSFFDRCPPIRIRLALEPEGGWQISACLNEYAPCCDCVCHGGVSSANLGLRLRNGPAISPGGCGRYRCAH